MGSGQSSAKAAEAQEADTGTQLFGSWDKPVAEAYAKKASKKGKATASKAADAANAALGSAIDLEAGAGVKPTGKSKTPGKQKGAGTLGRQVLTRAAALLLVLGCTSACCT